MAGLATVLSGALAMGVNALPASAATTVTYGFDGNAHLIVVGGSDTLFTTVQALGDLWEKDFLVNNTTAGTNPGDTCTVVTSATADTSGQYPPPASAPVANQYSNHQLNTPNPSPSPSGPWLTNCNHDTVASAYPAGSSTGISALNGGGGATPVQIPYEGANANFTANEPEITQINGAATAVSAGTGITSVTIASVGAAISNGDSLQITNGATSQNLTVSGSYTPSTAPQTITVSGTAFDTYTPATTADTAHDVTWATSANGFGTIDLGRSSRQPKTSGGSCPTSVSSTNNELACDTFWGFASDEVQVFSWNFGSQQNRGEQLGLLGGGLTADDLYNIWNCNWTSWSQVPGLSAAVTAAGQTFVDGPIVPWSMNTGSGTEATFQSWVVHNATFSNPPSAWNVDGQGCDRALSDGVNPLENDTKPLLTDANNVGYTVSNAQYQSGVTDPWDGTYGAGLVDNASSPQDPSNWIWWGSFGLMSAYQYNSQPLITSINANPFSIQAAPIYNPGAVSNIQQASSCSGGPAAEPACTGTNGQTPSTKSIGVYPLSRDLYMVSPKSTADCPLNTSNTCDLTGTATSPQPGDIQVNGASGGVAGAAREFLRFLCRNTAAQQQDDPFSPGSNTGVNFTSEISAALTDNGFAGVPLKSTLKPLTEGFQSVYKQAGLGRSTATSCSVLSFPNTTPSP